MKVFLSGAWGLVRVLLMNLINIKFLLLMLGQKSHGSTWGLEFYRTAVVGL